MRSSPHARATSCMTLRAYCASASESQLQPVSACGDDLSMRDSAARNAAFETSGMTRVFSACDCLNADLPFNCA